MSWASLSLQQRCKMFHRAHPEIKISASTLRRVYVHYKIKYKVIKRVKPVTDLFRGRCRELALGMIKELEDAREEGLKIIYVDEAVFTFNTFQG